MAHIKLLACRVMMREVSLIAATSDSIVDVTWMPQGLHSDPDALRRAVQAEIDSLDAGNDPHTTYMYTEFTGGDFDAIVLGYGLCSNGTIGLRSQRYKLVIPRAHDCITLFLGSKERYHEAFYANPGTMWDSAGWSDTTGGLESQRPGTSQFDLLVEQYGLEEAEELADFFSEMMVHYSRVGMIVWPELADSRFMTEKVAAAKRRAEADGWQYEEFAGDSTLIRDMLEGRWDEERFLVIPPGQAAAPTYDDAILKVVD